MKRFTGILIFALWLAGVSWYWRGFVSLAPAATVRTESSVWLGTTSANELMLARMRYADATNTRVERSGPIEFWSLPGCQKTHELLTSEDAIIAGPLPRNGDILIRRKGRLVLLNAYSGQTVASFPDVPEAREFARIPDKPEVLIADRTDAHLFEFGQETPRWTAPVTWLRGQPAGGFVSVSWRSAKSPTASKAKATLLNLDTGEPDHRFDHLGRIFNIVLSPNGKWAIVQINRDKMTPFRIVLCDVNTGQVLWTLPGTTGVDEPAFSADGQEVHATVLSPDRKRIIQRWQSQDGSPRPDLKPGEASPLNRDPTNGQYGYWYSGGRNADTALKRTLDQMNNYFGSKGIRLYLDLGSPRVYVRDLRTQEILGPLPAESQFTYLPGRKGLISFHYPYLRYYSLPPHRDYWWLAGWAVLPPLSLVALTKCWKRWRLRRTTRHLFPNAQPRPVG
jgi:hypothetical protein